jgi:hypothetical protein
MIIRVCDLRDVYGVSSMMRFIFTFSELPNLYVKYYFKMGLALIKRLITA